MALIPVDFKEVWTTETIQLNIDPNWTVSKFIETVTQSIPVDFEIVEAGQIIVDCPSEMAPALRDSEVLLKHKWGPDLNVAFYMRKTNHRYPQMYRTCPLCLEENHILRNVYLCGHRFCGNCVAENDECVYCRLEHYAE